MQFRVSLVYDQKKSAVRSGSNASQGVQISYSFRELRLTITTQPSKGSESYLVLEGLKFSNKRHLNIVSRLRFLTCVQESFSN